MNAFGGLVVGMAVKYADAIVKDLALGVSICFSAVGYAPRYPIWTANSLGIGVPSNTPLTLCRALKTLLAESALCKASTPLTL